MFYCFPFTRPAGRPEKRNAILDGHCRAAVYSPSAPNVRLCFLNAPLSASQRRVRFEWVVEMIAFFEIMPASRRILHTDAALLSQRDLVPKDARRAFRERILASARVDQNGGRAHRRNASEPRSLSKGALLALKPEWRPPDALCSSPGSMSVLRPQTNI